MVRFKRELHVQRCHFPGNQSESCLSPSFTCMLRSVGGVTAAITQVLWKPGVVLWMDLRLGLMAAQILLTAQRRILGRTVACVQSCFRGDAASCEPNVDGLKVSLNWNCGGWGWGWATSPAQ